MLRLNIITHLPSYSDFNVYQSFRYILLKVYQIKHKWNVFYIMLTMPFLVGESIFFGHFAIHFHAKKVAGHETLVATIPSITLMSSRSLPV